LPAVVFAIPLGYLADAAGRRRVFVSMAILFGLAGAAQALVSGFGLMLVLRFVQGVAFGALMPLTVTLIGDVYRGAAQLHAQSLRQVAMAIGEFVLPLAGAALAALSFRTALAAQGAIVLLAPFGALLLDDRRSPSIDTGYARELHDAIRQPGMPAVLLAGFLRFICKFALIAYLPYMLVEARGATLGEAAIALSLGSGIAAAVNLLTVRIVRRAAASRMLSVAIALVGVSLICFAIVPSWQLALVAALVFGLGDGVLMVLQNALVTEAAPDGVRGGLVAVSGMTRNAGKLVAPLAMGGLLLLVPVTTSFVLVGAAVCASIPALRPLRRLDGLLRPDDSRGGVAEQRV
jgi:MFS family permease